MASSLAQVAPEGWIELCRRAWDQYSNGRVDADHLREWEALDRGIQEDLRDSIEADDDANDFLTSVETAHANERVPKPSEVGPFAQYVKSHEGVLASRRQCFTVGRTLASHIMRARQSGRLSHDYTTVLRGSVLAAMDDQQGLIIDSEADSRRYAQAVADEQKRSDALRLAREAEETRRRNAGELGLDWIKGGSLGSGKYGDTAVFLRQNHEGVVVDRVAIKDSAANVGSDYLWTHSGTRPTEVTAMQNINGRTGSEYVVNLRSWAITADKRKYKLYMEFCTFGDLWNLDRQYLRADNMRFGYLPEPFAWSVLEGLLKTCLVMQYGDTTSPIPGWTPIVHRDLKTANVFVSTNTTDLYRDYPMIKLGDFGLAVFLNGENTSGYDWRLPLHYMPPEICNARILAPEQKMPASRNTLPPSAKRTELSYKANVWGIGYIMWSALTGLPSDGEWFSTAGPTGQHPAERSLKDLINKLMFSEKLRDVIYRCLSYQPDDRPTLEELRTLIDAATTADSDGKDYSEGLRFADIDASNTTPFPVILPVNRYTIGTKVVDAKWLKGDAPAPPLEDISRGIGGDIATPDNVLFGQPGRTITDKAASAKRKADDDGGGGAVGARKRTSRRGARPTAGDISGRSSMEMAKGGAEPGGTPRDRA